MKKTERQIVEEIVRENELFIKKIYEFYEKVELLFVEMDEEYADDCEWADDAMSAVNKAENELGDLNRRLKKWLKNH